MRSLLLAVLACACWRAEPAQADGLDYALGKALFDRIWTSSPASTQATDGLGPLFNARSCAACHPKAGRGTFREDEQGHITGAGLALRIGDAEGQGDPTYGIQLQTLAVQGLREEGRLRRRAGGGVFPVALTQGDLDAGSRVGGRLAPSLLGLGLLEQVAEDAVLEWADPGDRDGDGISGRANRVPDREGREVLGRFGWKAGKASLLMQTAAALNTDIGLSNPVYPRHEGDCSVRQIDCLEAPHGGSPGFEGLEIDSRMLRLITTFVSRTPAPAATTDLEGLSLFEDTGCADCHRTSLPLPGGGQVAAFSDLLLHDLGPEMADGIGDGLATGSEWRTAPLWGLARATRFLHDGRARSVREAITLHAGEAEASRLRFEALAAKGRARLLAFLSSL
ncbi:MAG: di-heme oxidoredictase family protein [Magnetovibrionaceae bacterium]